MRTDHLPPSWRSGHPPVGSPNHPICLSRDRRPAPICPPRLGTSRSVVRTRGDGQMWTDAHRARHEPRLKAVVAACAVEELAAWLGGPDPPRSGRATPARRVAGAIAWHPRVGGPWRALPAGWPPWRTVYGWFRRWLDLGLLDVLLREGARRRRRKGGRRPGPTLAVVDTQAVKCIAVRRPRGYDAGKTVL